MNVYIPNTKVPRIVLNGMEVGFVILLLPLYSSIQLFLVGLVVVHLQTSEGFRVMLHVINSFDVLPSRADQGSCAHKCVCYNFLNRCEKCCK